MTTAENTPLRVRMLEDGAMVIDNPFAPVNLKPGTRIVEMFPLDARLGKNLSLFVKTIARKEN